MKRIVALAVMAALAFGCSRSQSVPAYIFQRRHVADSMLQLSFRYAVGDSVFTDSLVVPYEPMPYDSVLLELSSEGKPKKLVSPGQ